MTEINVLASGADAQAGSFAADGGSLSSTASPGFLRVIGREVLRRGSAVAGLVWIVLLLLFAVFAPFICNSHPLLLKESGRWSSPLLAYLTPADVILQIVFWSAAFLYLFPGKWLKRRVTIWIVVLGISIAVCPFVIHSPDLVVYQTYRVDQAAGKVERAIYVPIPFSPDDHLRDQEDVRLLAPNAVHWAGTTSDSADLLSNLIYASRIAVSIGFISTGIAASIGIVLGALMGYYGGLIDLLGMRFAEIFDSIPTLLLLLIFVAVCKNVNLYLIMAIIGFTSWVSYAYFIRAEFLSLRDRDFVQAARAAGLPLGRILFRHMLPNGITPVIVSASFGVASAILLESTLSFLGIGLANEASWGNLLEQALGEGGTFYWWIALYPGLAIFLTVFSYNLIGEALRDALDPKIRKQE